MTDVNAGVAHGGLRDHVLIEAVGRLPVRRSVPGHDIEPTDQMIVAVRPSQLFVAK